MLKITDIKFERKQYTTKMPAKYESNPYAARQWLRTVLFEEHDVTYDVTYEDNIHQYQTNCEMIEQPWLLNLLDEKHSKFITTDVVISYRDMFVIHVGKSQIGAYTDCHGDTDYDLLAYEQLRNYLPVLFVYTELD